MTPGSGATSSGSGGSTNGAAYGSGGASYGNGAPPGSGGASYGGSGSGATGGSTAEPPGSSGGVPGGGSAGVAGSGGVSGAAGAKGPAGAAGTASNGTSGAGGVAGAAGSSGAAGAPGAAGAGHAGAAGIPGAAGAGSAGAPAGAAGSAGMDGLDPQPPITGAAGASASQPAAGAVVENPFRKTSDADTSTFSIDVDSGSYTLARAAIADGVLPEPSSVRVEEFLNYFHFHYAEPEPHRPLALYTELGACPWDRDHELFLIGIQGHEVDMAEAPPANLVYLIDVSGSMNEPNKLPLLKSGFRLLSRQLRPQDRVSIVTYAGQERVVLQGASGADQAVIDQALSALQSGGSTNGEGGIQKAYELAQEYFISGGTNRVLLATDGDFNVGLSETQELVDFIAAKRQTGVFLSVYGFGAAWSGGNYNDEVAEQLADNGNGVYFYIDGEEEARRAFVHTVSGSLVTVAKDVKLQVAFNPARVAAYRLIGYENRLLANHDFSNDAVDAGELGASMSVTALYEIVPAGSGAPIPEPLPGTVPDVPEAQPPGSETEPEPSYPPLGPEAFAQVRVRYKDSDSDTSKLLVETRDRSIWRDDSSLKFLFAAGVSEFAMALRGSQYLPNDRGADIRRQIDRALAIDGEGAVREMSTLVQDAFALQR
ncbi:MAG TPA: von Willebrand factor type A domain-containing protein [Polyangiaceae bacterium]|nr:von Willebrand factor type A domain-containing protein [Polyangiaceae bacterium]